MQHRSQTDLGKDLPGEAGFIEGVCRASELEVFPFMDDELSIFAASDHPL